MASESPDDPTHPTPVPTLPHETTEDGARVTTDVHLSMDSTGPRRTFASEAGPGSHSETDSDTDSIQPPGFAGLPRHYRVLDLLGRGGGGTVYRAYDTTFGRHVALKVAHVQVQVRAALLQRFLLEARITAQLPHPGIVAVHDRGRLDDGRPWYSMKEVRGRTLRALARELRDAGDAGGWRATAGGWTLRRAVEAVARAAEAVGYAHSRGVVHRDLKPDNIMVGEFGEVIVMDWGLARLVGASDGAAPGPGPGAALLPDATRMGVVLGTPAYLSPEQARGDTTAIGPPTDVYGLGATLYDLLSGHPPRRGSVAEILRAVRQEPPPDLLRVVPATHPPVPPRLAELAMQCLEQEPGNRPADGSALAAELRAWLDGASRRAQAQLLLREARMGLPTALRRRRQAADLRRAASTLLEGVPTHAPEARKIPAWSLQDRAAELDVEAVRTEARVEQACRRAVALADDLDEAHELLAGLARDRLVAAEAEGRTVDAALHAARPHDHNRGRFSAFLRGEGRVSLITHPAGVPVEAYRYVRRDRRLHAEPVGILGHTPLREVPLPHGSYLLVLRHPTRPPVHYPVQIGRLEHWDGIPPGDTAPAPVPIPPAVGTAAHVPAGWCRLGGDPEAVESISARRVWIPAFHVDAHPVTNADWLRFVHALQDQGEADVEAWIPRCPVRGEDHVAWSRDPSGRVALPRNAPEPQIPWHPRAPVVRVSLPMAQRCAAWRREETGRGWRLPDELEWEKAARGVDGRRFPWGDFVEGTWACCTLSHGPSAQIRQVDSHPVDVSPYGVHGVAGNSQDWCHNGWSEDRPDALDGGRLHPTTARPVPGDLHLIRGGSWRLAGDGCRVAARRVGRAARTYMGVGRTGRPTTQPLPTEPGRRWLRGSERHAGRLRPQEPS